ncbi:hypothetical protein L7F22_048611 [Adiantum nelumboides]|nr:hypothetical protein [Adiantum nelumboides]
MAPSCCYAWAATPPSSFPPLALPKRCFTCRTTSSHTAPAPTSATSSSTAPKAPSSWSSTPAGSPSASSMPNTSSPPSVSASASIRHDETRSLLHRLHSLPGSSPVDLRSAIFDWMLNVTTRVLFSERADEDRLNYMFDFPNVFRELSEIFTQPMLADFVPYLHPFFDPGGMEKRLLREQARMDAILESIVRKRLAQVAADPFSTPSDVLTTLLQFEGKIPTPDGQPLPGGSESKGKPAGDSADNDAVKSLLLVNFILPDHFLNNPALNVPQEMLAATTDTTTAAVEWAMVELLYCARDCALERLKQEIAEAMEGKETNQVDEAQLGSLAYLEAVLKEALRLHPGPTATPTGSLLLPHFAKEAAHVAGYHIPANTILAVNACAIGRDESVWADANLFKPERFLAGGSDNPISLSRQTNYQLLAFGKGRRGCNQGMIMAGLVVANLVHNFDWHTSTPPDLTEKMSAANVLTQPLLLTLSPRQISRECDTVFFFWV